MGTLGSLQIDAAISYLIAVIMPALDAIFPVLPSETAIIALGVATAGSADPRIGLLVAAAAAGAFLGCLLGLAAWMGVSMLWSISPDRSWGSTNRTLVYAAFALAGVVLGAWLSRPATAGVRAAAVLLGLLYGWALLAKCVPAFYSDYGRIARLRAPIGYWNALGLLCAGALLLAVALVAAAE